MNKVLYEYEMNETTWVYLASLLCIAVFFKFSRFWSTRNFDLAGLIAFAPGLLLIRRIEPELQQLGYAWMFIVGGFFLFRMLIDPLMVRRPLLEPNLSPGGMTFLGLALLVFLMVNVLTFAPDERTLAAANQVDRALNIENDDRRNNGRASADVTVGNRPGYVLMMWLPSVSTAAIIEANAQSPEEGSLQRKQIAAARATAILSHLAVVIGLVLIGARHFDNIRTGVSAATLYLLLPYTAQMTGHVDHALPAALLVWAVLAYHDPLISGMFLGLAAGVIYYPLYLLPLWCGFYWHKGLWRFLAGFAATWLVLIGVMAFFLHDTAAFWESLKEMFGWSNLISSTTDAGFWRFSESSAPYRIPVMVAFVVMATGFAIWPAQKNLGTLISCSAAVMLGTQFWHLDRGGAYMAWYLPLLLLTVFRPNLEDRVAANALNEGWFSKRRWTLRTRAA